MRPSACSRGSACGRRRPLAEVIAHRGASGDAPENTLAAFDLALEQGADALELDVRPAADGSLMTVHDPTLARTTGDERTVADVTAEELRRLDHPAQPTTLDAVLARYGATRLFIDLKDPAPAWERAVIDAVERHAAARRVTLQSFDTAALVRLHAVAPALAYSTVYRRADSVEIDLDAVPAFASAIAPWHPHVDADLGERARARGLVVRPWAVDDAAEAERLLALGVSSLFTNLPRVVCPIVRRASRGRAAATIE
jgi:glycerophosphoryl diester phosphodiesterase